MSDAAIIPYCKGKDKPNSGNGEAMNAMSPIAAMIWQCMDQIAAMLRQQYRQVAKSGVQ